MPCWAAPSSWATASKSWMSGPPPALGWLVRILTPMLELPRLLVDADAARSADPQPAGNRCGLKRRQQAPNQARQQAQRRDSRRPQHCYAGRIARRESKHVGEVEVQRNQTAALRDADLQQAPVVGSTQILLRDGFHIVPSLCKEPRSSRTEVLIKLELHAALWPGRSTNRPRLISAP